MDNARLIEHGIIPIKIQDNSNPTIPRINAIILIQSPSEVFSHIIT